MNKSQIFSKAWQMAREAAKRHSESQRVAFGSVLVQNKGVFLKASEFFAECLKSVYAALKRCSAKSAVSEPVNSINYSGAPMNAAHLAVIDMIQRGDRRSAYDAIEA